MLKTIRFDMGIVEWAVREAAKKGIPYQTFINSVLKGVMNKTNGNPLREEIRQIVKEELEKKAS